MKENCGYVSQKCDLVPGLSVYQTLRYAANLTIGRKVRGVNKVDTGCSGKIVFFHNSLQPLPRHIAVRNSQSSQRNASVKSIGY